VAVKLKLRAGERAFKLPAEGLAVDSFGKPLPVQPPAIWQDFATRSGLAEAPNIAARYTPSGVTSLLVSDAGDTALFYCAICTKILALGEKVAGSGTLQNTAIKSHLESVHAEFPVIL